MSENQKFGSEVLQSEEIDRTAETEKQPTSAEKTVANHHETSTNSEQQLASIREQVGKEAQSGKDIGPRPANEKNNAHAPVKRELQEMMRLRTLKRIRKQLPYGQRALSKVIHAKPVEILSTAGEKTIARPYGILGGGLVALIGSSVTFYMAKHYGFRYSFILFFVLFVSGYLIATALEAIIRTLRKAK